MTIPFADVIWVHGDVDCTHSIDPLIQVHQYDCRYLRSAREQVLQLRGQPSAVLHRGSPPPNPVARVMPGFIGFFARRG